ncbi:metallophosphoesterase [Nevskia sp.]|uniref:metallophosphoesterase n=1 Tax=Nevskia sp. TaxID=1929292 RepID=UPI0025EA0B95|nr:metallophosphoesterase [Nevskia sp.]
MLIHTPFHHLPLNERGRDFVVGDVHGHAALLDCLIEAVHFDPDCDRLLALGDLIDRGPESLELLRRVEKLPWFYSLRGNHEAMLKASASSVRAGLLWHRNGGQWGQEIPEETLRELVKLIDGLPLAMSLPLKDGRRIGLIHAEVPLGLSWSDVEAIRHDHSPSQHELDPDDESLAATALWGRSRITACEGVCKLLQPERLSMSRLATLRFAIMPVPGIDQIIAGHSYSLDRRPVAYANLLFIDTGVFEDDGRLTLVEPLTRRCWQSQYDRNGRPCIVVAEGEPVPAPTPFPAAFD